MDYKNKYLKYKLKYLSLYKNLIGSASPDLNSIKYIINFLWMNKIPNTTQKYIIPFKITNYKTINYLRIDLPDFNILSNYINIIEWCKKNNEAKIYLWHDFPPESNIIIQNTEFLINSLASNSSLLELIKNIYKIYKLVDCVDRLFRDGVDKTDKLYEKEFDFMTNEKLNYLKIYYTYNESFNRINFTGKFKEDLEFIKSQLNYNSDNELITFTDSNQPTFLHNLEFHSVLELNIWNNPELKSKISLMDFGFSKDKMIIESEYLLPVYFRVDLVRLIILYELAESNKDSYIIYADLDTIPLDKELIFTQKSIDLLNDYGLVLPGGGLMVPYENSLHVLAGEENTCDPYMLKAIKMLIYFIFIKIYYCKQTQDFRDDKINNSNKSPINDPQNVYSDYKLLFNYFFALKDKVNVKTPYFEQKETGYIKLKNILATEENINKFDSYIKRFCKLNEGRRGDFIIQSVDLIGGREFFYSIHNKIPVNEDFSSVSPHGYSYSKKYLKKMI